MLLIWPEGVQFPEQPLQPFSNECVAFFLKIADTFEYKNLMSLK
jgi:hypothetical protein